MSKPWDPDALFVKAKLFLNHAMDDESRQFDEQALWASLALELLAKAALAKVSPVLIAVPTEEGNSLLVASGLVEGDVRFTSVQAKTLFARCARAFKPFSEKDSKAIASARNDYLHAAAPNFTPIPPDAWWPRFWAQAHILVNACDRVLEDLVGSDRVALVEGHLTKNKQNIGDRREMLIERARQRLGLYQSGQMRATEAQQWAQRRAGDLSAELSYSGSTECPACGADGKLEGEDVEAATHQVEQVDENYYDSWMELTVSAEYFSCDRCRLVLDSFELVDSAGLPATFEATTEVGDYWEPEYGND